MKKNKSLFIKIIIGIIALVLIGIILWQLAPLMLNLSTKEGQLAFKEQINSMGFLGLLMLFGLNLIQIVLIVLPGEPLEVLAGMCYGPIGGTLFILCSAFASTCLIYFLIGILGKKFIHEVISKEKLEKIENSKILKNKNALETAMIFLFLIPGTPKDLLTYVGALLPIKPIRFILISTFARIPSVISSCFVGSNLSEGNLVLPIIIYAVTFIFTGIFVYFQNKKGNKETKEIMQIIK